MSTDNKIYVFVVNDTDLAKSLITGKTLEIVYAGTFPRMQRFAIIEALDKLYQQWKDRD